MSFNIWAPQGQLSGLTGKSNANVIYEGNAQILSGTVFKMWCTTNNGAGGLYYYESLDGLTSWTAHPSNPILSGTTANFPTVVKVISTYYLYSGDEHTAINVRTSSDGITWGSSSVAIPLGTAGSWDDTVVAQLRVVPGTPGYGTNTGETYYAYYEGDHTSAQEGLATSTDLINWTKSPSNPIFSGVAFPTFQKIGSNYYMWAPHGGFNNKLALLGCNGLNRWSASNPAGPWTLLTANGCTDPTHATNNAVNVIYPSIRADFDLVGTNVNPTGAAIGDPFILSALGNMYIYWTRSNLAVQNQFGLNAAIATGVTPAQQVSGYEGMVGAPIPGFDFNINTLATDTFTRANGFVGANWTPVLGGSNLLTIASNRCELTTANTNGDSFYNAVSFPNDQYSRITVQSLANTSSAGPTVRANATSGGNEYRPSYAGTIGSGGQAQSIKITSGSGSGILVNFTPAWIMAAGDTLMAVASGTNIILYYNGSPFGAFTDSSFATGSAGVMMYTPTTVTDAQITNWNGGGLQASPVYSISGSAGVAGATVSYSGTTFPVALSVTADGSGNYTISNLAADTYTVTPSKTGFSFSPASSSQVVTSANITGVNFTASANALATPVGCNYPGAYPGASLALAFQNPQQMDLIQVINEGGKIVWNLDYLGNANTNPSSPTSNAYLGRWEGSSFSTAFPNANQLNIFQVVGPGGHIVFFVDYQGNASTN